MSWRAAAGYRLIKALTEEGLVPKECVDVQINIVPDGVVTLEYKVLLQHVDLEKLGRALAKAADEATKDS